MVRNREKHKEPIIRFASRVMWGNPYVSRKARSGGGLFAFDAGVDNQICAKLVTEGKIAPAMEKCYMKIFAKDKNYSLPEVIDICNQNGLITVDCLKDENMISVEKAEADCLFELHEVGDDLFKLTWAYA
ncbi:MAG: hypothetical protein COU46_00520 [Candidatus Niyogibacteria bacterium CG10_big_fil_rev_8_21_14_0_10_42_19]|uniref:Uncharacterized protein n=1 Tax=Candidatus Niyogibacteria bacterium CG10_big_fil_rev_8_21_14_0_10_42_19 TaxID=1974725 RepID=A0A2H0TIM4_9BACT|nr:MAG: hypothetical protein COU46_00520 [Candidatus Niyogibacteria bacterium CG10_big_fil_rev_8_21_14_0_10_42_19]